MTLKEFLEYREHRFDEELTTVPNELYRCYAEGWTDAVKDIRTVLEAHGFDLEISLE